ncbi:MAG: outer membrane protein assembly factor BamC [Pseudomonadota bacterium]|nr:outer membrane protein assembly factor BamC [Pseudomonadota bacterium]
MKQAPTKLLPLIVAFSFVGLSGCSSISSLMGEEETDYRVNETQLAKNLEMPPNLFHPSKKQSQMEVVFQSQQATPAEQKATIPTYQVEGVSIQSNLSERWLELDTANSDHVWQSVKRFMTTLGMQVEEERKDIGIIKTGFTKRTELAPLDDVGPLTKLFNSWRPELAEGIYDRFVARVETDEAANKTRVYFHHHMLYSPDTNEEITGDDRWRVKPYNPVFEAEALYQAMIFFGSNSEVALAQLKTTGKMSEMFEGEQELEGLILHANLSQSWGYLQAMVYRADWQVEQSMPATYDMWVKVPAEARAEGSFISKLAFWKSEDDKVELPEVVLLKLTADEKDSNRTFLTANVKEGESPLTAEKRKYLFEKLGLLGQ